MKTEKKKKKAAPAAKKASAKAGTSAKKTVKPLKTRDARKTPADKPAVVKKADAKKPEKITGTARKTTEKPHKITKGRKAGKKAGKIKPGVNIKMAEGEKETRTPKKPAGPSAKKKPGKKIPELPEEYGENRLFLIVVDPNVVYAGWEIKKEDTPGKKGDLTLRIFDVTGTGPESVSSYAGVDHRINSRVGSGFFEIRMHGREIIAEIGVNGKGRKYRVILRSGRVAMPELLTFDELGIAGKLFKSGIPVGY